MIKVHEIMSDNVITLKPDDRLYKARELMSERHIRHLPIVDDEANFVGLLSERDLLKAAGSCIDTNSNNNDLDEPVILVSQIMTTRIKIIYPNESLIAAGLLMQKHKYGCLPVVKNNKLVGIITDSDFVGVAINLIEQMEQYDDID
ncbi:MAG: CBS domain-containing protein [Gammaproteobacteria bacterium]|nr:CBS domain-containing protein [Gammaproteobacteria bacterium]